MRGEKITMNKEKIESLFLFFFILKEGRKPKQVEDSSKKPSFRTGKETEIISITLCSDRTATLPTARG